MANSKIESKKPVARVLLVVDHPAIRELLAYRIAGETDLDVCGEAANPAEAIRIADSMHPDVAIIDSCFSLDAGGSVVMLSAF